MPAPTTVPDALPPLAPAPAPGLLPRAGRRPDDPVVPPATPAPRPGAAAPGGGPRGVRGLLRGPADDPAWARPLLLLLLVGTAALYLVDLSSSGTANSFYAAAVKSGTQSLQAWLFGSLDAGGAITVDKPPVSLWLMVLSARILGFSSFSMLVPQALMGVASVAVLHATVRRWHGPAAGLLAGALLALTPVAALMFRFNNPDALLVLLMSVAALCVVRAVDAPGSRGRAALRWMLLAGAAIGFAFLTKMAQGLLVLPAFGVVYLVASPLRLRARIGHLLAAAGAVVVAAGWFVLLVELWPAGARPYIGGSTNNSLWELAVGYNGLGRILGSAGGAGGGTGGQNTGFGGAAGVLRLFGPAFGTQIAWFLPAALLALVAGLVLRGRAPRTDRVRAGLLLWGGWLLVTAAVFSFMSGTIHPYYSVALAPAVAAVTAIGGVELWRHRDDVLARGALALLVGGTAVWGAVLMHRDAAGWLTGLVWAMAVGGVLGALVLAATPARLRRLAVAGLVVGVLAASLGAASFTVATAASGHTGSIPTAGPATVGGGGFGGGGAGGPGGSADATTTSTALTDLLDATSSRWSAAVVGDQSAAGYILSGRTAVMAIGGWSGSDPAPTLAEFQQHVADGDVTYFLAGGGMGGGRGAGGGSSSATEITAWVAATYASTTVDGVTVYDLTAPA
ncbi:4-amino-4-deoxy-L-arabinose transferase [Friedmanniella luteola]|uniref:4-amino-4-deoxy-L-arabinose transferase n=1 Tax=Friedmanniella luteola TaxID=546871 RepID=A0A1H1ZYP9_9ACTN|nr:glycosyltransferase family 39 protein [Friedmanniella luteola]SDT38552.1 4-amino-4-deoxy-L-arabinose transferase [Friedmanniella luteola]